MFAGLSGIPVVPLLPPLGLPIVYEFHDEKPEDNPVDGVYGVLNGVEAKSLSSNCVEDG